ncbi:MAG: biotin/lipoyl-binding protein, partial [Halioglobus sp.]
MFRLLLTMVLGAGLVACSGEDKKEAAPAQAASAAAINLPASSIVVAKIRGVRPSFEYPAVVEAVQLARIRPEISAVVKAIHVSAGLTVQKGDLLLEF